MKITKLKQLAQARDHAGANKSGRIQSLGFQILAQLQLGAMNPAGGEHPFTGKVPLHPRHGHLRMVGKQASKALGIVRLLVVVDLAKQAATKFIDDFI